MLMSIPCLNLCKLLTVHDDAAEQHGKSDMHSLAALHSLQVLYTAVRSAVLLTGGSSELQLSCGLAQSAGLSSVEMVWHTLVLS